MEDHEQIYIFPAATGETTWTVSDFRFAVNKAVDFFSRHLLPVNDHTDPRGSK
jgi:hypothetical protein